MNLSIFCWNIGACIFSWAPQYNAAAESTTVSTFSIRYYYLYCNAMEYAFPAFVYFQEKARQSYTEIVSSLISAESPTKQPTVSGTNKKYEALEVFSQDNITQIFLNRPEKKNAITWQVILNDKHVERPKLLLPTHISKLHAWSGNNGYEQSALLWKILG